MKRGLNVILRACANVRIRNGSVAGDCRRPACWHCPYCKADRCPSHAMRGFCGACGSQCDRIFSKW